MAEAGGQEFKAILQLYSKVKARKVYLKPYLKKIKIKIKVKKKVAVLLPVSEGQKGQHWVVLSHCSDPTLHPPGFG